MSQPQEPWNCRPLPAEKQQEMLVERDKEQQWNSSGSCTSCPRAPVMALSRKDMPALLEMKLLPWDLPSPLFSWLPGCSDGQSYPGMIKVIPQG